MANKRPNISGRAQDDSMAKNDSYNKDSRQQAVGNYMRTFSRSKTGQLVTAWDDEEYLIVLNNYIYPLADTTGNVDSATVPSAQFLAWLDATWELYFTNANLKDLVGGEEDAWTLYFAASFFIASALQIQYNFRCMLPAYTESDAVPGGTANIPYFSQSSFDIFCARMKDVPIPKGVFELVSVLCTWGVQLSKPYEKYTLRIPGSTLFPLNCPYDLEDLEEAFDLLRVNQGNAITHAKKFGLKMGSWKDPIKPIIKQLNDPDVIAFFCHAHMEIVDKDPAAIEFSPNGGFAGDNVNTDYTLTEFTFFETPNESVLHVLAPIFGVYDATNNPYGGWLLNSANAAEYFISAEYVAQHGTSMTRLQYDSIKAALLVMQLHKCVFDNKAVDGKFNVGIFGTQVTTEQGMDDVWPLAYFNNLFYGKGRGMTETNNDLLNYLGRLLV